MDLREKLEIAWHRIQQDRRTDFLLSDFEFHAFHRFRSGLLDRLADEIRESHSDYTPKRLRTIRVPKGSNTTRPGTIPEIDDRIYYQSLVDDLAEQAESRLSPLEDRVLHSYRYAGAREASQMFHTREASYRTFNDRTREIAADHRFVVVTDIASFYERIYHHELENTLRGLGGDRSVVDQIMTLLRKWRTGSSYGIPQGIWPSDYLGNLYLDPIDKQMVRGGWDLCRYVDDIRVGADSYLQAQEALLTLEERVSALGLSLSTAKTSIVEAERLEEVLFPYKPRFDEIFGELRDALSEVLGLTDPYFPTDPSEFDELEATVEIESARRLFREELAKELPHVGVSRFCLSTFRTFSDADVLDDVLRDLRRLVEVTPRVVSYLSQIARRHPQHAEEIRRRVAEFVKDSGSTVYDWQRMWMLQALDRLGEPEEATITSLRDLLNVAASERIHEAVVLQAILLIGRHGDDADRTALIHRYNDEHSEWLRRGILFAIRHLDKAKRNHFYKYSRGDDHITDAVIAYAVSET